MESRASSRLRRNLLRFGTLAAGILITSACGYFQSLDGYHGGSAGAAGAVAEAGDAAGAAGRDGGQPPDAPACTEGRVACGSDCVDLATDDQNCGRCGHDCFGGGCTASMCQPVTIATGQRSPFGIAVGLQHVYWANNEIVDSFASCPIAGCGDGGVTTLVGKQSLPADVFFTNGKLYMSAFGYWADGGVQGSVLSCDPRNCASTLVTIAKLPSSNPVAVIADMSAVYWANSKLGTIGTCSTTGCTTPGTFAQDTKDGPWYGLAQAGGTIYWTSHAADAGAVYSCPIGGCATPTRVSSSPGKPFDLALDAKWVYWTTETGGQVLRCPLTGCKSAPPEVFADNQADPAGIAADASGVYWLNKSSGAVLHCDTSGCGAGGPTVLATGQGQPWEIVLDATSLYWTDSSDGRVMRLAKP